jgi:threonyl-tRNA synthetase
LCITYGDGADILLFKVTENITKIKNKRGIKWNPEHKMIFPSYDQYFGFHHNAADPDRGGGPSASAVARERSSDPAMMILLRYNMNKLAEAAKRDHRKLGRELDLFSINEEAGAGLVLYHPKGALLRTLLEDFEKREHLKRGYQIVIGPQILKTDLWKRSGHYDNYRDKMYFTKVEDDEYGIKPMNCLAHMLIYKSQIRSYRDLPLRYFELGTVHRHEKSGELHGLLRVRGFTQDDAHILCRPDQLNEEIVAIIDFVDDVMKVFGFEYEMELSTRPEKSIGADEDWERCHDDWCNNRPGNGRNRGKQRNRS